MADTKICKHCGLEKPLDRFLSPPWKCKDCDAKWYRDHRRKKREAYLAANPKPIRTSKSCKVCGVDKPFSEYRVANREKGHLSSYCKPCAVKLTNAYRATRGRTQDKCAKLKTTVIWYQAQVAAQDNRCAVCKTAEVQPVKKGGKPRSLAIDHDHETGKVRGLLCFRCNTSIHMLEKHGFEWATAAIDYLKRHKETRDDGTLQPERILPVPRRT